MERWPMPAANGGVPDAWLHPIEWSGGGPVALTRACERQYLFVHSGSGTADLDGWQTGVQAGEVLFVPSRTVASVTLRAGTRLFWFGVADAFLIERVLPALGVAFADWSGQFPMPRKIGHWVAPGQAHERDRLWAELALAARRLGGAADAAVAAYVILTLFEKYHRPHASEPADDRVETLDAATAPSAGIALAIRFRSLLEDHLADHWKVADYCRALGVRPAELVDCCRRVLGMTPSALIHERLLLDAKRHLLLSQMPAAQVAYRLGFSDAAYFSRYFKKQTGLSPSAFRRSRGRVFEGGDPLPN